MKSNDYRKELLALSHEDQKKIEEIFLFEAAERLHSLALVVAAGEAILMVLDATSGFFGEHPLNYLNLFAELLLVVSSLIYYFAPVENYEGKKALLYAYKSTFAISILIFIGTDVWVRSKTLGAYLVFMFVPLVTPFMKPLRNNMLYVLVSVFTGGLYILRMNSVVYGTLFQTICLFLAFAISTEYLRQYYLRALVSRRVVELSNERFHNLTDQTILSLSNTVEAKDLYTKGHSQRVAAYSKEIARRMGYDEARLEEVYYIGLLHDIGKIGVSDTTINKKGRLSDEEYEEIKKHPSIGYEILKQITELPEVSMGARYHHERYDGKGYPDGLKGDEIPKIAQIIAVSDSYDAMTSNRSYRQKMDQAYAREQIEKNIGLQFAPDPARIMLGMIDEDTEYRMCEH